MSQLQIILAVIGSIVTILGGIYAMLQFVFQVGKTKEHLEGFEKNSIDRFDKIDRRLGKIDDNVEEHTMALVQIYTFLGQKYPKRGSIFAQKNSPRALNDLGMRIYGEIQGQEFLKENKDILFEYIEKEDPQTRLDVETYAMQALMSMTGDKVFNRLKDYVYEAPAVELSDGKKYEITIGDICFILSIPLRDMYINEKGVFEEKQSPVAEQ